MDQIRSYRPTHDPSVSFKETNEKITCEEAAENYNTKPNIKKKHIKQRLTTTHTHTNTHTQTNTVKKSGKAHKASGTFLATKTGFLYQFFRNRHFFSIQAKPKIVSALQPTQKVGLLRCFSLAFDNSKIRLKKKRF